MHEKVIELPFDILFAISKTTNDKPTKSDKQTIEHFTFICFGWRMTNTVRMFGCCVPLRCCLFQFRFTALFCFLRLSLEFFGSEAIVIGASLKFLKSLGDRLRFGRVTTAADIFG